MSNNKNKIDSMIVLVRRNIPEPTQPDNTPEPDAAAIKKAVAQSRGVDEKDLDEEEEEPEVYYFNILFESVLFLLLLFIIHLSLS